MAKLKVFRTAIGFHDAYVAAPSRAAALRAWGADKDLFARGAAEEVDDPELTAEALARPGEVVRRSRGTAAEQLAALPPKAARKAAPEPPARKTREPKPDRTELDAAEAALAAAEAGAKRALEEIAEREAALARERRAAEREGRDAVRRLERERDRAAAAYGRAMAEWEGSA